MIKQEPYNMVECRLCKRKFYPTETKIEYVATKGNLKHPRYYCHDCLRKEGMKEVSFGRKEK